MVIVVLFEEQFLPSLSSTISVKYTTYQIKLLFSVELLVAVLVPVGQPVHQAEDGKQDYDCQTNTYNMMFLLILQNFPVY